MFFGIKSGKLQKILSMEKEYLALLNYLKEQCKKEYRLLQADEIIADQKQLFVGGDERQKLSLMLTNLSAEDFIDLKYFDGEVFLLKPLSKSFLVKEQEEVSNFIPESYPQPTIPSFGVILIVLSLCAFLGGMIGALLGCLLC